MSLRTGRSPQRNYTHDESRAGVRRLSLEKAGYLLAGAKLIPAAGIWRLSAGGTEPERTT